MTILIVGSLILIGIHSIPWSIEGRAGLQQKLSANSRGAKTSDAALPLKSDLIVVAAGTTVFIVIAGAHAHLFGYPVF